MEIRLPYSRSFMKCDVAGERIKAVLVSGANKAESRLSETEIVKSALLNPISSPRLSELARDVSKVLIITSDHTRPMPSHVTMPLLLEQIRLENPKVKIKIIVATGCHRSPTREELINRFGEEIVDNEEIVIHDSRDSKTMTYKGVLPSGAELWINSLADWADLIVAEGFIEPHFFAGFSGGRKSILPGIASEKTVLGNHCSKFIAHPLATTGVLQGNPIHLDMVAAARMAGLKFILNVVINDKKQVVRAFAGHFEKAHEEGCKFVSDLAEVKAVKADIVITSNGGYPLDQNIYQSVKGMTAAEVCVNRGGVIIMVSGCDDGHGGESFYRWFAESGSPEEVTQRILGIDQADTLPDQWQAQILARVLSKCKVIMVSNPSQRKNIEDMHMMYANDLESAIRKAENMVGSKADIVVIPDGVSVIVKE